MGELIRGVIALGDVRADLESPDVNKQIQAKAFEYLKKALKDVPSILYYNPLIKDVRTGLGRTPDILWIHPYAGIVVIEVKAWSEEFLNRCTVGDDGNFYVEKKKFTNPYNQALQFRDVILDLVKDLKYPVSWLVFFPNLSRESFSKLPSPLQSIFIEDHTLFKGEKNIKEKLFNLLGSFASLGTQAKEEDFNEVRRRLFPYKEVYRKDFAFTEKDVPLLDLFQEKLIHGVRKGVRILRGVPGSGKTVVLASKALHEKLNNPSGRVLVVTYNHALLNNVKAYISYLLNRMGNPLDVNKDFDFYVIDALLNRIYKRLNGKKASSLEEMRQETPKLLEKNGAPPELLYDAIIGDESQDFLREHIKVLNFLKKRGGLLVLGVDETQRIYPNRDWTWKEVGIEARGRNTIILRRSYRNPSCIFDLAVSFLKRDNVLDRTLKELELEGAKSIRTDKGKVFFRIRNNEFEEVKRLVSELLKVYKPGDIFILCATGKLVSNFVKALSPWKNVVHGFSSLSARHEKVVPEDKLVVMPYKSAKGLERPVVIVTGVHQLPYKSSKSAEDRRIDRKTLYVALTRAQKELYILGQEEKGFIKDLEEVMEGLECQREIS